MSDFDKLADEIYGTFEDILTNQLKKPHTVSELNNGGINTVDTSKPIKTEENKKPFKDIKLCASGEGKPCICQGGTVFYGERYKRNEKDSKVVDTSTELTFDEMMNYPYF